MISLQFNYFILKIFKINVKIEEILLLHKKHKNLREKFDMQIFQVKILFQILAK